MRKIDSIDIHCSATRHLDWSLGRDYIRELHVEQNGWDDIGYQWIIRQDGSIEKGRHMGKPGAHVRGHNLTSVGIVLMGGLADNGLPTEGFDHFAEAQKASLAWLVDWLMENEEIPAENVAGHRDHSPDLNDDGIITPDEWLKACPTFDVSLFMQSLLAAKRRNEFMGYCPPLVF